MVQFASTNPHGKEVVADPTPMGLLGLAIGCSALIPMAFGQSLGRAGLETAAIFCLLFGAGCQFLAGFLNLVNKNLYGGTLFLTFAFNWVFNWWMLHSLANGVVIDPGVLFATEVAFLVIFVLITWGFGHFSSILFVFLVDIDLLYALKITSHIFKTHAFDKVIALLTVGLAGISLWIAFALLLNPVTGRKVFTMGGPLFWSKARPALNLGARTAIVAHLYNRWTEEGASLLPVETLVDRLIAFPEPRLRSELDYLAAQGIVHLEDDLATRITHAGIEEWERHLAG
jgi:succinate-acetate transporter protein